MICNRGKRRGTKGGGEGGGGGGIEERRGEEAQGQGDIRPRGQSLEES